MIHTFFKAVVPLALTLLLSGCSDNTELGNRAIIEAIAVDYSHGEYTVSALLFSGGGSGGDTLDASGENVIKVTGTGKTLTEAIDSVSLIDGKELYMSETKLLILGCGFTEGGVDDVLNTLYYDMRCSLNMPVCCAYKAEMLTDMHFTEGITSAEKPLFMIENAYREGASPKACLLDILADNAGGKPTLIPFFTETENGYGMTTDENGKTAVLNGSYSVAGGKLSEYADSEKTAGLMLLSGQSDKIKLNFTHKGKDYTCEAYGIDAKLSPERNSEYIKVTARFRGRNGSPLSDELSEAALKELTELVKKAVQ